MKKIILVLSIVLISSFWLELMKQVDQPAIDTTKTFEKLTDINKKDIKKIQQEIDKIQDLISVNNTRTLPQRYAGSVIVGDSMVEALSAYNFLPAVNVAGSIGKRTDNIYEQVDIALSRNPKNIFICLGLNDIPSFREHVHIFKQNYQNLIDYIKRSNPKIEIYLNSLIPLPKEIIESRKVFTNVDKYNQAMKELCKENKLTYIDNTKLIKPKIENFESDGVHPKLPYFKLWIQHMADTAVLK